jgi:hypothetical protein
LILTVRSRSIAPDQITYSNRYEQIWSIQSSFNPTATVPDPNEAVPANENTPCISFWFRRISN